MVVRFLRRHRYTILYGAGLAMLLFLLKWLEWRFIIFDHAFEIYSGLIAVLFTGLGIWLAIKLAKPKVVTITLPPAERATPEPAAVDVGPAPQGSAAAANAAPGPTAAADPAPDPTPGPDPRTIAKLGLSTRECEVLQLMAEGLSNQEIAARLFVSLNTIKTHSSRIFEKLDVRRRTQAVEKARRLKVIADPALHPKAS